MFWFRLKNFISTLIALATAVVILVGIWGAHISRLSEINGERIFYLNSASSQGLRAEELRVKDFPNVKGESVRFEIGEGAEEQTLAKEIAKKYGAEILFTETACGITSFYCYTERWTDGVRINGEAVNLHIAVSATQCAVGTPIIFDGF